MKVLILEDDERISIPLKEELEHQKWLVQLAFDGVQGLKLAQENHYDLILLDLMLPGLDGLQVIKELRSNGCSSAVIVISALDKTTNKITGLNLGADDYLAKPFELDELTARIGAVMRRGTEPLKPMLAAGKLNVDPNRCVATFDNRPLDLTPTEFRLIVLFLSNPNRAFSKDELIDKIWNPDEVTTQDVVKTQIKGLRSKLDKVGAQRDIIETVYGVGYRLQLNA